LPVAALKTLFEAELHVTQLVFAEAVHVRQVLWHAAHNARVPEL